MLNFGESINYPEQDNRSHPYYNCSHNLINPLPTADCRLPTLHRSPQMDLSSIPIIDHHCHALRRFDHPLGLDEFRAFFAETTDPDMPPHIARTVFYMRMVRDV